jgi:hypothetical protein
VVCCASDGDEEESATDFRRAIRRALSRIAHWVGWPWGRGERLQADRALVTVLETTSQVCPRCVETGRTCPSCVQRRRYAWSLVNERGETFETAGRIMMLAPERVRQLVDHETDRRDLERFRCDSIPVELTRAVIAEELAHDPDLTISRIAGWLEMCQSDFERSFLGKNKHARPKRRVNVSNASKLMIALGRAPNELPGC